MEEDNTQRIIVHTPWSVRNINGCGFSKQATPSTCKRWTSYQKRGNLTKLSFIIIIIFVNLFSWHVLNRDNVLRVKRDEAAAKQAEEEKARRAAIAVRNNNNYGDKN